MQIFSSVGKGFKRFFAVPKKARSEAEKFVAQNSPPSVKTISHGTSFGVVYANDSAKAEIETDAPRFAVGSIIVREKLLKVDDATPETIIAMVKREANFSPATNDWEFFVFSGNDFVMKMRETQSSCSACHAQARETDFVFRDYLK